MKWRCSARGQSRSRAISGRRDSRRVSRRQRRRPILPNAHAA
jgi:hypothetical protein